MFPTEEIATNHYFDSTFKCDAVKIGPGEYYYTQQHMAIVTVLGSCVSACITDKVSGIGGMNHFMLPNSGKGTTDVFSESMRYGTYAMEVLINALLKNGARRENLEAKIFGGGNVMTAFNTLNIGERNAEFIRQFLKDENIRVTGEDLVSSYARKIYYFPKTAVVFMKKISTTTEEPNLMRTEETYVKRLNRNKSLSGGVELF